MIGRPCPGMERELMRLWEICFWDAQALSGAFLRRGINRSTALSIQ